MSGYGVPVIILGVFALLTGFLGCATGKFKNPCFAIPFGIITFVIAVALLALGAIAAGSRTKAGEKLIMDKKNLLCKTGAAKDFAQDYNDMVGKVLCTDKCPCDPGPANRDKDLWKASKTAAEFRTYGRVFDKKDLTTTEESNFKSLSIYADVVPFTWKKNAAGGKATNNWMDCYTNVLSKDLETNEKSTNSKRQKQAKKVKAFIKKGANKFIEQYEKDFSCASICKVPLFYISKPVSEGPPQ